MKRFYYLTMHKLYFSLFLLALNWADNYETVDRLADTANHYWKKTLD